MGQQPNEDRIAALEARMTAVEAYIEKLHEDHPAIIPSESQAVGDPTEPGNPIPGVSE